MDTRIASLLKSVFNANGRLDQFRDLDRTAMNACHPPPCLLRTRTLEEKGVTRGLTAMSTNGAYGAGR